MTRIISKIINIASIIFKLFYNLELITLKYTIIFSENMMQITIFYAIINPLKHRYYKGLYEKNCCQI